MWSLFLLKLRGIYLFLIQLIEEECGSWRRMKFSQLNQLGISLMIFGIQHLTILVLYQSIVPPKIKMFLWLLLQGSLSIKGFLAYRKNICSFCDMEIFLCNGLGVMSVC